MTVLGIILLVLFVIGCLLLIFFVLIQDEQGDGVGGMFGGGSSSAFGPRSGNILTKITSTLGIVFLVCSFALAWINRTSINNDLLRTSRQERLQQDSSNRPDWLIEGGTAIELDQE